MCSFVIISGVRSHTSQARGCYLHAILHIRSVPLPSLSKLRTNAKQCLLHRHCETSCLVATGHSLWLHWHCVSEECSTPHISHLYYPNVRCCCVAPGNILHLLILQVLMIPINCALAKHQSFGSAVQCRCPCPVEPSTDLREVSQCQDKCLLVLLHLRHCLNRHLSSCNRLAIRLVKTLKALRSAKVCWQL